MVEEVVVMVELKNRSVYKRWLVCIGPITSGCTSTNQHTDKYNTYIHILWRRGILGTPVKNTTNMRLMLVILAMAAVAMAAEEADKRKFKYLNECSRISFIIWYFFNSIFHFMKMLLRATLLLISCFVVESFKICLNLLRFVIIILLGNWFQQNLVWKCLIICFFIAFTKSKSLYKRDRRKFIDN